MNNQMQFVFCAACKMHIILFKNCFSKDVQNSKLLFSVIDLFGNNKTKLLSQDCQLAAFKIATEPFCYFQVSAISSQHYPLI